MVTKMEWSRGVLALSRPGVAVPAIATDGQGRSLRWSNGQALRLTCP
jgi:hypothetical protein